MKFKKFHETMNEIFGMTIPLALLVSGMFQFSWEIFLTLVSGSLIFFGGLLIAYNINLER